MTALLPSETDLIGSWVEDEGRVLADDVEKRITALITDRLAKIATGNWTALYRDPADGRLWEVTYPQGGWQGGGPKRLSAITREEAMLRYPAADL